MNPKELIELSGMPYGRNGDTDSYGDVSYKEGSMLWIRTVTDPGNEEIHSFNREKIHQTVPQDIDAIQGKALLHDLTGYRYTAHLHSPVTDALMCSRNARQIIKTLFGENACFVQYSDPGYDLYKKAGSEIAAFRRNNNTEPGIIFLENNGILFGAETANEIKHNFNTLCEKLSGILAYFNQEPLPYNILMDRVLPALRMLLSSANPQVVRSRNSTLIEKYCQNQQDFHKIAIPLTPGIIEACRTRYMFIDQSQAAERVIESFKYQLPNFINEYGYLPSVVVIKGAGIFGFATDHEKAEKTLDAFEYHIKICHYALQMGGTKYITPEQVANIDKKVQVVTERSDPGILKNKIAVIISEGKALKEFSSELFAKGMNVIVAGMDESSGNSIVRELNNSLAVNKAVYIKTDLSKPDSVKEMVSGTVREFGGMDVMIIHSAYKNEITLDNSPDEFTSVNDSGSRGFFTCTKYASEVMKLQNQAGKENFSDIIRINSQPAGRGGFLNQADEGLTGMFATELAPFRIKVNTITHGHFFEHPMWTDPLKGLFASYLRSGKFAGARNIEDVKKHFESMVPLSRGCRHVDIIKAICYLIDQEYETGQVITVTGGLLLRDKNS